MYAEDRFSSFEATMWRNRSLCLLALKIHSFQEHIEGPGDVFHSDEAQVFDSNTY